MRRKDREMNKEFALDIIDRSHYGVVSMVDNDNTPYGIPLSIAREGNTLFFHSSKDGKKVKILDNNQSVSIAFVGQPNVPELYTNEELDEIVKDKSKINLLISSVFTTEFESAVVTGKVKLIDDENERIEAMRAICIKFTPTKMKYFDLAVEAGLGGTNIYSVEIEDVTAKRKKYDSEREEMKFGRLE